MPISRARGAQLVVLAITLAGAVLFASWTDPAPTVVGFVANLSGRGSDLGIDGRDGAMLAVEEWNELAGAHAGIELQVKDAREDPVLARAALESLAEAGASVVIGPMTSSMAMVLVPTADSLGVLLVAPTVTTDELSGIDDNFVRVVDSTRQIAAHHARFLLRRQGWRSASVVMDLGNRAYTESWLRDFRAAFAEGGAKVDAVHTFTSSPSVDFARLAAQMLQSGSDGVLLVTNALDAALICQQLRRLDPEVPISASAWAATERLIELGGQAVEGIFILQFFDRSSTNAHYVAFRERFRARFDREPGFPAVAAYDAATAVLAALRARGSDRTVKQALLDIGDFEGVQGTVHIDRNGDSQRGMAFSIVRDGRFEVLAQ